MSNKLPASSSLAFQNVRNSSLTLTTINCHLFQEVACSNKIYGFYLFSPELAILCCSLWLFQCVLCKMVITWNISVSSITFDLSKNKQQYSEKPSAEFQASVSDQFMTWWGFPFNNNQFVEHALFQINSAHYG